MSSPAPIEAPQMNGRYENRMPTRAGPLTAAVDQVVVGRRSQDYPNHDQHAEQQVGKLDVSADVKPQRQEPNDSPNQSNGCAIPNQHRPHSCQVPVGFAYGLKALEDGPAFYCPPG